MHNGCDVIAFDLAAFRFYFIFSPGTAAPKFITAPIHVYITHIYIYIFSLAYMCHVKGQNSQWQTAPRRVGGAGGLLSSLSCFPGTRKCIYIGISEYIYTDSEVRPIAVIEDYEECIVAGKGHEQHCQCLHDDAFLGLSLVSDEDLRFFPISGGGRAMWSLRNFND